MIFLTRAVPPPPQKKPTVIRVTVCRKKMDSPGVQLSSLNGRSSIHDEWTCLDTTGFYFDRLKWSVLRIFASFLFMSTNKISVTFLLRFLDHTQLDIRPVGILCMSDQHVVEAASNIKWTKSKGRKSMPSAEFEPAIPAIKRPQNKTWHRTATGIGKLL